MNNYQYRYSNYVGNRVVCESNWLLQASSCDGRIYDNLRKKFIEPHPHPFLISEAFNIKCNSSFYPDKQPMSVVLAREEMNGIEEILFAEKTEVNLLFAKCINPEVKVTFLNEKTTD